MNDVLVKIEELKELVINKLIEAKVKKEEASIISDLLIHADCRGVRSHGTIRIEHYINRIKSNGINIDALLEIKSTSKNAAVIDSQGGFGHIAMHLAANEAIKAVKKNGGMFAVSIQNSSHCGALSYYVKMALKEKFISMIFVNTDRCVVPFGSADSFFGTNPIALGLPGNNHNVLIDMATSEVALGKIFAARESKQEIPSTWGVDKNGSPTTDPFNVVSVSPLGGYKGSAMATMVEGLTGFFTGAFGPHITTMYNDLDKLRNVGGFILIMDSDIFGSGETYLQSVDKMYKEIKDLKTAPGFDEVYVPGEIEDRCYEKNKKNGIPVYQNVYDFLKS